MGRRSHLTTSSRDLGENDVQHCYIYMCDTRIDACSHVMYVSACVHMMSVCTCECLCT